MRFRPVGSRSTAGSSMTSRRRTATSRWCSRTTRSYPHLSVFENICFGLRLKRTREDEVRRAVHQAAEILDLTALLDRKPSDLSGGQRQRVAMGRAIVRDPKVFLFDEPLSNLDAKLRNQMRAEIKRPARPARHDGHLCHARSGRGDDVGRPHCRDARRQYRADRHDRRRCSTRRPNAFVASFIGSPPMNLVPATVASGDGGPMLSFGDHGAIPAPAAAAARLAPGDAGPCRAATGAPHPHRRAGAGRGRRPSRVCSTSSSRSVRRPSCTSPSAPPAPLIVRDQCSAARGVGRAGDVQRRARQRACVRCRHQGSDPLTPAGGGSS